MQLELLDLLADALHHAVAISAIAELHVAHGPLRGGLGQRGEIVLGEMQHEVLRKRDHRRVDQTPALERQILGLRQRLALNLFGQIFELVDLLVEHLGAARKAGEPASEAARPKQANQRIHLLEGLLDPRNLVSHRAALIGQAPHLVVDRL